MEMDMTDELDQLAHLNEGIRLAEAVGAPQCKMDTADARFLHDLARRAAPAADDLRAAVKPLEWHKSHMPSWNDDWHTIPTGYTVRCADENGWKWSGLGAHGHASTADWAKREAQEHHNQRILSALSASQPAAPRADDLRAALEQMLHAVCGETGFAEAVRRDSGLAYPWPALDIAEERARAALRDAQGGAD